MTTLRQLFDRFATALLDRPLFLAPGERPPTADERAAELEAGEALDREEWDAWSVRYDRSGTERRTAIGWSARNSTDWSK